jgi:hypothetical protein
MTDPRRFPPPWIAEETDACFIVRDASWQALAWKMEWNPIEPRCSYGRGSRSVCA